MRIHSKGFGAAPDAITLKYNGASVEAQASDTVASALIAAGDPALRVAREDDKRGVFCGMGVCAECTVMIEGKGESLACMTPATDGMVVESAEPRLDLPSLETGSSLPESTLTPDVVVIGAGPSGLAAAAVAAESGLDVVLLDERGKLGGQYYKQPAPDFDLDEHQLDGQYRRGRALIGRARASGVHILDRAKVWGAFAPDHIVAASPVERWVIRAKRVVLATGAYERGVPMPGWTLPGVMTTGAAQTLSRSYQVSPGQRVLVAGNGPLNMQVAAELAAAGATVVALVELATPVRASSVLQSATMALSSPGLIVDGVKYGLALARARVPIITGSAVVRMTGDESGVTGAVVARLDGDGTPVPGTERSFEVDAVCMGYGFLPSNEIARMLGCSHRWDESLKSLVVERDEDGRTSVPETYVIGDSAQVHGAKVAQARGVIAGASISADLTGAVPGSLERELAAARRNLARNMRFQTALNRIYAAPVLTVELATPETTVCRCESLSFDTVSRGLDDLTSSAGASKRVSRVGMGKCQGRYCGPVVVALSALRSGVSVDERSGFAPQVPFKPTPISVIASPEQ
ncbi:FAD-dependent oxidoreductase [Salinibacterium sp. G-O1]|uniref:FAD-dependent oxidoreductase n=1 Tax=Salinibacterium sp. G-O1 TaxID=3046208 RepID=UPI0024BBABEA|nr:FAD-dependent oxidoreductase [Salinibacterium sp. G-O1]MDJ0334018.1 FAD-dependent oxidoreductase [Salinibacterium sp. G-O1]